MKATALIAVIAFAMIFGAARAQQAAPKPESQPMPQASPSQPKPAAEETKKKKKAKKGKKIQSRGTQPPKQTDPR